MLCHRQIRFRFRLGLKVYYRPTQSGTSERAHRELPGAFLWSPSLGKWWGDYFAEEDILMDEFIIGNYSRTVSVGRGF